MSDHEIETFESTDAGASLTYPAQAGNLKKNGHVVINGHPCKIVDISTSKTGKHGHAKCNITAIDIFTGKKYEDVAPSSHNVDVPNIFRKEYTLTHITEDGFVCLMDDSGNLREDLKLPTGTDDADKLARQIQGYLDEDKEVTVTVLKSMDIEMISSAKVQQEKEKN